MIIVLTLLCFIPIIISGLIWRKCKKEDEYYDFEDFAFDHILIIFIDIFALIGVAFCILAISFLSDAVVKGFLVDEKIEIVQSQNAEIEEKVKVVVENYLGYESSTYKDLKPEEVMMAASMYPALQSNQIVQEQIKVYEENNKKIVSLKEEKVNAKADRWWLYFGN